MARKRMIDPSFWSDEKLGECTRDERLLFMGLISNADDKGCGRANPKLLKSFIFPYDDLQTSDFEKWLSHLGGLNLLVLYTVDGQSYYYLPNFLKHQTINKPTQSKIPNHDVGLPYDYGSTTVVLPPNRKEEKRREKKEKEDNVSASLSFYFADYANGDEKLLSTLNDYEKMRKSIKKPMTDKAKELLLKKLDSICFSSGEKIQVLEQSILNNWQDVYPIKGNQLKSSNPFMDLLREGTL